MIVKIKKLNKNALMPTKAHVSDAGFDLYVSRCGMENGLFVCHSDIEFEESDELSASDRGAGGYGSSGK